MKNLFKSLVMIAAAAVTLAGCTQKENLEPTPSNDSITLKFNIKNSDDVSTKALLGTENGKNFLNWEDGDKVGTYSVGSFGTNTTTSNNNASNVDVNGDEFTLNVKTYQAGNVTKIYSYYPYSSGAGSDKTSATIAIPVSQYMTADGFDADAMPMAGEPVTVDITTVANTDTPCGTINFSNLGSIIHFKVYSSVATTETLTSVKYIATTGKLGGNYSIDLTAIDSSDETSLALSGEGTEAELTTYHNSHPTIGTGRDNAIDVYMVVAPGTYANTQVVVTTSAKTYTLDASNAKTFVRSHVKPMYVDIQNGTPGELPVVETWTKVTSASDFTAGTYYILNWDEGKYLPNDEAGSAPTAKSFTGTVTTDMRWEATESDGGLIFKNPSSELYLWGQDGTNNGVRVKKDAPASASVKVWKFTANSTFGVVASVGTTRYLATYNNNGTQQDWRNYQAGSLGDGTNTNNQNQVTTSVNNFPAVFYKLDGSGSSTPTSSISVSSPINIDKDADTHYIDVTRTNFDGTISVSVPAECTWLVAEDSVDDDDIEILVEENTGSQRSVTITLSGTGISDVEVEIIQAGDAAGTASNPYSASEAYTAARALTSSQSVDNVYVQGYISEITYEYSSTNNNLSFNISDDGLTSGNQLNIYKMPATAASDFMVGDFVKIKGTLLNFNGNKPEIDANAELISQVKAPRFSPNGGNFTTASLSVTLTADDGATIRYTTGETLPTSTTGTVYSSAISINATTTINALAVKDGIVTGVVSKTFTKIAGTEVQFGTSDFSGQGTANTGSAMSATKSGITFACDKGYGTTQIRCYKGGTITISAESGKTITRIDFTFSGTYTGGLNTSYTGLSTSSWSSGELASQARLTAISVTYE